MSEKPVLYCSFCGKSQHEVRKLIAGPAFADRVTCICDECVDLCSEIVHDEAKRFAAYDAKMKAAFAC